MASVLAAVRTPLAGNLMARVVALGSLSLASLVIARTAGPAGLGAFTLLRLMPWLVGLITSCGIYAAAPFFLSGERRAEARYRPTMAAMAVVAGVVGAGLWLAASPALADLLFPELPLALVYAAAISVLTQLTESTAKACSQGFDDLRGSHRIMVLEEFVFIPWYVLLRAVGADVYVAIVLALPLGDVTNTLPAWIRLARRGYFHDAGAPSPALARDVMRYGARAGVGSVMLTLNARLDFALVGALVGPVALGVYAVASRYAELLRLPYLALNYVLYPEYARAGPSAALVQARRALSRAAWVPVALAVPMALAAPAVLPLVFGSSFRGSSLPACILLVGLAGGAVNGVASAYFSGSGRPGINSLATGGGLVATLALDLLLIPPFGVLGAAAASTAAYLTTTIVLAIAFRRVASGVAPAESLPELVKPVTEAVR